MSYTFKTRLIKRGGDKDSPDETSYYQFKYPNLIRFSQLRDSVRIGLDDWQDIQASFFMEDAIQLQGEVVDISTTGTKIKFEKDFDTKAKHSNSIADCQLLLPDGSLVLTRTQIVGTVYDEAKDISYVRCKYLGLNQYDEKSLELLISERVDELDHAKLVGLR
jgi:c-di-GMP-binding flagellar brake protein YcgR